MSLISLLVLVLVFGLILYLVEQLPIEAPWRNIARIIIIVIAILALLNMIGLLPGRIVI